MKRTLVIETTKKIGKKVLLKGWVDSVRDHGKLVFVDLRDRSGIIQLVSDKEAKDLRSEFVIEVEGKVQKRRKGTENRDLSTGSVEVKVTKVKVLTKAEALPFDISTEDLKLELPTLLDYRPLTLRHPKQRAIFKVQEVVIDNFRKALRDLSFTEFQAPNIVPVATEGGSEIFPIDYYGYDAYLGQSPQLYKQIMVGIFERVFTVTKAYRAEPSVTTRHLSEYVTLDCEFGFIDDWGELMDIAEEVIRKIFSAVSKEAKEELKMFGATLPKVSKKIPRIKMQEAQEIIYQRTKRDNRSEPDLEPEDEREICRWSQEEHGSELVFITHYPTKKRPFYAFPDPEDPELTLSFDLLGRGLEWVTGGQRINDYEQLLSHIKKWGNKPEDFDIYLKAFKYGMPPEGGFAIGAERVTKDILGLKNVKEASLFPRDMGRIDFRLSQLKDNEESGAKDLHSAITFLLNDENIKYELFEHKPVYTSEAAARVRGTDLASGAKALVMKADKKPILVVLPGDKKVDMKKFKKEFNFSDVAMVTKDEVIKLTEIEVGAVPPFGNLMGLPSYYDKSIGEKEKVVFNAGTHDKSIEMKGSDLIKLINPETGSFSS